MKHLYLSALFAFSFSLQAQVVERVVTMEPTYVNQVFFDIETGATTSIAQDSWDIAFDVSQLGTGIVLNEGAPRSSSPPALLAYMPGSNDFDAVTSEPTDDQLIFNDESSWSNGGAFNLVSDSEVLEDVGWGLYDDMTETVSGTRVFIIELRDGSFRKIEFTSLAAGVYSGRHANLDGSDEITFSINKSDYAGKRLAYYKLTTNQVMDLEPEEWDIKFTRYFQIATQGGVTQQYPFTGILHNDMSVQVAEARDVNVETVDFNDYTDDFSDDIYIIGDDWKGLDGFTFFIIEDLCYFIRSLDDDNVYKLIFEDFTGSLQGETSFITENVGVLSAVSDLPSALSSASIFPNPAFDQADLVVDLANALPNNGEAQLTIFDKLGRQLSEELVELRPGVNQFDLPVGSLISGHYLVRLNWGTEQFTQSLFIR
ncbi:MAG: HmuY family protein [Bacteroidota bacterium]